MRRGQPIEAPPPRTDGAVNPWIEISAWILAFAILLAAQCAPERAITEAGQRTVDARDAGGPPPGAPAPP